ncbi:hypothetical protein KJ865_03195, partial [Myxococcota bacterium]|nr:hypothetical protein [Myxococcota bacterium]
VARRSRQGTRVQGDDKFSGLRIEWIPGPCPEGFADGNGTQSVPGGPLGVAKELRDDHEGPEEPEEHEPATTTHE